MRKSVSLEFGLIAARDGQEHWTMRISNYEGPVVFDFLFGDSERPAHSVTLDNREQIDALLELIEKYRVKEKK